MTSILPPISGEQQAIVDAVCCSSSSSDDAGCNAVVDAVAGSGKTTTLLYLATHFPESQRILVITYNSKLKLETRKRVQAQALQARVEVHSYHSFGFQYYHEQCVTDLGLLQLLTAQRPPKRSFAFDCLIIDEVQDMTPTYYAMVVKLCQDNACPIQRVCILGDRYQSIYRYNGADERFITYAERAFAFVNTRPWRHFVLSVTYRLPRPLASFVNHAALRHVRLHADDDGGGSGAPVADASVVRYQVLEQYRPTLVFEAILRLLRSGRAQLDDVFVLAPSLKRGKHDSPVRVLANMLSAANLPIFVPSMEEEVLDQDVLKGKLVFSTFHQVKGLERKVSIIFNFDASYFKYYHPRADSLGGACVCPNELYVAMTRASRELWLLHQLPNDPLPFVDLAAVCRHATMLDTATQYVLRSWMEGRRAPRHDGSSQPRAHVQAALSLCTDVTQLVQHLSSLVIHRAMQFLSVRVDQAAEERIPIAIKARQAHGGYESVGEITGVAIPAYYEWQSTGTMTILKNKDLGQAQCGGGGDHDDDDNNHAMSPATLLQLANAYCAQRSGYAFKLNQITDYDWLTPEQLEACVVRLRTTLRAITAAETNTSSFSYQVKRSCQVSYGRELTGFLDCVAHTPHRGWDILEIKCTAQLKEEHAILLALYAYLWRQHGTAEGGGEDEDVRFWLVNVLTNERWQIRASDTQLESLVHYLLDLKYGDASGQHASGQISDAQFVTGLDSLRQAVQGDSDADALLERLSLQT
jgi:hypothetical protein